MRPTEWNHGAFSHITFPGGILDISNPLLDNYLIKERRQDLMRHPACLYGVHNSSRIVAQRGVFLVFGADTAPLEDQYAASNFPDKVLQKIVIPRQHVGTIRRSLFDMGVTDSVVFPDLEGLARELRRDFDFND